MSNSFIGLVVSIAGAIWVYLQVSKRLGGANPKQAAVIAGVSWILLFAFVMIVISRFFPTK